MPEEPLSVHVVVEPAPQARPYPDEGLVRDLHALAVDGHEPRPDEALEELAVLLVRSHLVAGDPGPDRFAVRGRHDEAEEEAPQAAALGFVHPVVERLRRLGDGILDPAGGLVAGDRQRRSLAARPRLPQHVREHRQGRRLPLGLVDEQVDETGLEPQAGPTGRSLDRSPDLLRSQGTEEVEAVLEDPGDVGEGREVAEVVGAQREDQPSPGAHVGGEGGEERGPLGVVVALGDGLLDLVDDEDLPAARLELPDRVHGCAPGVPRRTGTVLPLEGGDDAGAHEGGLPGARGPDHDEDTRVPQPAQAGGQVVLAAEEALGVGGLVGQQAAVRAGRGRL